MHSFASTADLTVAQVMVAIAAMLLTGALLARAARRLGQPPVLGEIAAGIVLGPSLLGLLPGDLTERLFPASIRPSLSVVANIGLLLFMFLIGWSFNKKLLAGRAATAGAVSAFSVVVAFGLGAALALVLYRHHDQVGGLPVDRTGFVLFLGAAMAITAFPVLARILRDSGLMRTRVGALALVSAAVDDVIAWCLLACVSAIVSARGQGDLLVILALSAGYLTFMLVVVRPLLARVVGRLGTPERLVHLLPVLAGGVLLSSFATTWIGIHAIFGAFVFGFVMPRPAADTSDALPLRSQLEGISAVLLPVFFIVTGLNVDIAGLTARNYLELAAILLVAIAGKFVGACVPARAGGMPWRDVATLGVLMNTRGLTELIILNAGVQLGVLDNQMFTMMVVMALVTTGMAGPLLSLLAGRGQDRPAAPELVDTGRPRA
ncbi:cation:proton antiporter domain-containing protein [Kineosporia succinea]|uniref:Kef-type K+ transport system membrane component KefB n=1 Tax=Kineosporia succinea TaxID=84632 RepID=A0ABT9PAD9_9ACTN|nr:cation:proton antiporter [Kineosporia succinea]MDP9829646.1 Kef-type K+ transport system membrane component KefB [Kineosporia succinea]